MPHPIKILLEASQNSTDVVDPKVAEGFGKVVSEIATDGAMDPIRVFKDQFDSITIYLQKNLGIIIWKILLILLVIILGRLVLLAVSKFTKKTIQKNKKKDVDQRNPRIESLMTLLRSAARYFIFFLTFAVSLQIIFNENSNVLAGLFGAFSISAVAVGFGTQSIVKDIVFGLFFSFENQFNVGDYIETEQHAGYVEAMALRVTYLRTVKGTQIIIPNSTIERVINYSHGSTQAQVIIVTPYESNTRFIIKLIEDCCESWATRNQDLITSTPQVLGISNFNTYSVDINVICDTVMLKHWEVERNLRMIIKETLDANGISFFYQKPFNQANPDYVNSESKSNTETKSTMSHSLKQQKYVKPVWQQGDEE